MRHLIFFIFIFLSTTTFAEKYQIVSIYQKVYIKNQKNKWQKAKILKTLDSNDSIKLSRNSNVKIVETKTGNTYEWKEEGKFSVLHIVKECRIRQSNWILRMLSSIYDNITTDPKKIWYTTGNTKKGDNDGKLEYTLAQKILEQSRNNSLPSNNLIIEPIYIAKKEFYFSIKNTTAETLYVNVVAYNVVTKEFSILYDIRNSREREWVIYPIVPQSTLNLSDFQLYKNRDIKYFVFGTKKPTKVELLEKYINEDTNNINKNLFDEEETIYLSGY